MRNLSLRRHFMALGLRQWQVAEAYGISEGSFCRLLRHELTEEQQKKVMAAIELAKKKQEGNE